MYLVSASYIFSMYYVLSLNSYETLLIVSQGIYTNLAVVHMKFEQYDIRM